MKHDYRPISLYGGHGGHLATSGAGTIAACSCRWQSSATDLYPAKARDRWVAHVSEVSDDPR